MKKKIKVTSFLRLKSILDTQDINDYKKILKNHEFSKQASTYDDQGNKISWYKNRNNKISLSKISDDKVICIYSNENVVQKINSPYELHNHMLMAGIFPVTSALLGNNEDNAPFNLHKTLKDHGYKTVPNPHPQGPNGYLIHKYVKPDTNKSAELHVHPVLPPHVIHDDNGWSRQFSNSTALKGHLIKSAKNEFKSPGFIPHKLYAYLEE